MNIERRETRELQASEDVVALRQLVRSAAIMAGFSLVDQTKTVTAASELGRNTVIHGKGGLAVVEVLSNGARRGVRLTFQDSGPGIPDIEMAMRDGFTSGGGLGLGLGGSKRLLSEFEITSSPGSGTRVVGIRWK